MHVKVVESARLNYVVVYLAAHSNDNEDEFEKWQKEIAEAEAEAEAEVGRAESPPDGEEEFTDDDGTTYKWDRCLRAWVPQVSF